MTRRDVLSTLAASVLATTAEPQTAQAETGDWRNILTGTEIPRENYSDQPYVVFTKDGNWLCVLTTGKGKEGAPAQHIISSISTD